MSEKQTKTQLFNIELNDGTKVSLAGCNGFDLIKARKQANAINDPAQTPYFLLSEKATFNGEKWAKDRILELDIADILLIEDKWNEFASGKNSRQQET